VIKKLTLVSFEIVCFVWTISSNVFGQDVAQNTTRLNLPSGALGISIHGEQTKQSEKIRFQSEADKIKAMQQEQLPSVNPFAGSPSLTQSRDTNFIVFGYQQTDAGYDYFYLWPALTHVGASFTYFDGFGNITDASSWTGRSSELQAGGVAQANGTKVVMVLTNQYNLDSAYYWEYSVFTSATNRQNLVNNVVSLVTSDGYCQGVSLDIEPFVTDSNLATGLSAFFQSLYTTLKAISSNYEVSYYAGSSYSSSQMPASTINNYLDYILYSCYDWSVGVTTPTAVSDVADYVPGVNGYLNAGVLPSKIVLAISAYGHEWETNGATYTSTITDDVGDYGYFSGYYDVTLQPAYGGPYTSNYESGQETGWYTYNDGTNQHLNVDDDPESLEYKFRMVKSWQDSNDVNNGKRLRGVAFWSLYWLATAYSYDPIAKTVESKTRLYPQLFQLTNEIFNPPGNRNYLIEKFEGPDSERDYRWRMNPNESPDNIGVSITTSIITNDPSGSGGPSNSNDAMMVTFTFASTTGNRLFFRHELLNDNVDTTITDSNHCKFYVNRNSKIQAYVYSSGNYAGKDVRMLVMDTARALEMSNSYSLASAGWQYMQWDLTNTTEMSAYTTSEPAFKSGTGVLNASTTGAVDIGFVGFLVEGSLGSGTVYFDEISYTPTNSNSQNYVINEFSYGISTQEFIEIYGPAGALPNGMQLRLFDTFTTQSIFTTINLTGTIINSDSGYGYWVVGDTAVANVNQYFGKSGGNMPTTQPSAIQLYNATNGNVYDSVVYQAFGGLRDLIRQQTLGVTQNGYAWIGENASGSNSMGQCYSMGRYPDGSNTWVNETDFSFMPATPGKSNGGTVSVGASFNFSTAPAYAFQTYQPVTVINPTSVGLPYSPDSGNAWRCSDPTGGGTIGVVGDASLGYGNTGYSVSGYIYLPLSTDTPQANAVGICGSQGSNFFTPTKSTLDKTGYESGYWLIYENRTVSGSTILNDGLADHPGTFYFEYAHNNNMDTTKILLLASVSTTSTGITGGAWTSFNLSISPGTNDLTAQINGVTVYSGSIPTNGPTSGAFQVGFRENYYPLPTSTQGLGLMD
jgi:hypothetical protein